VRRGDLHASELWASLVHDERHGPRAGILTLLTVVAGTVDGVSILRIDHVFVANVTGNVIFIGLALVGAREFSFTAPVVVLVSFLIGAALSARVFLRRGKHRGHLAYVACVVQSTELVIVTVLFVVTRHAGADLRLSALVILALGMGAKSALARAINVPGLTTSVVTTTLTGLASDAGLGSWRSVGFLVRVVATSALLVGAVLGGALAVTTDSWCPLALATAIALTATWWSRLASNSSEEWTTASS
jgi:uncharacterized membrane protein YoaK (UPF0700 family)